MLFSKAKSTNIAILFLLSQFFGFCLPEIFVAIEPSNIELGVEEERINKGRTLFENLCFHCHGVGGDGKGPAGIYLDPKPRDFSLGIFKYHSTQNNSLPSDQDLYKTITEGLPGTPMPAFNKAIDEEETLSLIKYIKSFSKRFNKGTSEFSIEVGLEPALDNLSIAKGKELYRQLRCVRCHGELGEKEGTLPESMKDVWGGRPKIFNLQYPELYKAGYSRKQIYIMLSAGIDGTPMNPYEFLSNVERWHLVHFVQSLFEPNLLMNDSSIIISKKVENEISLKLDDPIWETVSPVSIRLNSLKSNKPRTLNVLTQSIRNKYHIAFRLQWDDSSADTAKIVDGKFFDEIALEFPLSSEKIVKSPFYGMGERRKPVNLWHWRADYNQKAVEFKTIIADSNVLRLVNVFKESPVEELNSRGFRRLTVQSLEDQQLMGRGKWQNGRWKIIFRRNLFTQSLLDVQFKAGESTTIAFAVWDGANRDKSSRKLVSYWKTLKVE